MKQWNSSHQHFSGGLLTSQKQVAACDLQKWKLTSVSTGNLETDDVPGAGNVKRPVLKTVPWREPRSWDRKVCKTYQISKWLNKKILNATDIAKEQNTKTFQGNRMFLPPHPPWLFLEVLVLWSLMVCWVPAGGYLSRRIPFRSLGSACIVRTGSEWAPFSAVCSGLYWCVLPRASLPGYSEAVLREHILGCARALSFHSRVCPFVNIRIFGARLRSNFA